MNRTLLVFDGECDFCRQWIARWRASLGDRVDLVPYQEVADRFPEIPRERFARAVHLIELDGRVFSGAEAVFRALALAPGRGWLLALYRFLPGFAPASEAVYRLVASHRPLFHRMTRWIWGPHLIPPGETLTVWMYQRLLAIVYLAAFVSLWTQIAGLAGEQGILPAGAYLDAVGTRYGALGFWILPTLGWITTADWFLNALCAAGVALSVLHLIGLAPLVCLAGLWLLYLSVSVLAQEFCWFQWDSLLLEAGLLAIFLAPWRWRSRPSRDLPPSRGAIWLSRWLLFRLCISSAAVKLLSGDPTWRSLTALRFHFETQPLPPWTAWYVQHLPPGWLRAAAAGTFVIEGLVPLLFFAPRRIRFAGAALTTLFQLSIAATGNYAFFNWLTLALCVLLLDDGVWPRRWRGGAIAMEARGTPASGRLLGRWPRWLVRPAVASLLALSLVPFLRTLGKSTAWLGPIDRLYEVVWPWRSVNRYGLFAVMTRWRPEIILEGSADGRVWMAYEFPFKPGDPLKMPGFVAPHQPRVDWQLWFAALSDFRNQPWFLSLCRRLLEGSPPVTALLKTNPFPRSPPRYLRAIVYEYRFTEPAVRQEAGAWWTRVPRGAYIPVLTLENGQLVAVAPP